MRRYVLKITIYFLVILSITIIIWRWMALQPNNYSRLSHEINVKRQLDRIQDIKGPKIIFIGGSGCGFGLCSPMIHERYRMPVVNTGTHGGLGLRLEICLFKPHISENDIVVVIPEYAHFKGDYYLGESTVLRIFSSNYQEGYKLLNLRQQLHLFKYIPAAYKYARFARSMKDFDSDSPYSAEALNEFGDIENSSSRTHQTIKYAGRDLDEDMPLQENSIKLLYDFNQFCKAKGATMVILPPAYRDEAFIQNEEQINEIWTSLSVHQLPIVSSPKQYEFPDSLFYDTDYHLTYEGAILRTSKLISDLDSACHLP